MLRTIRYRNAFEAVPLAARPCFFLFLTSRSQRHLRVEPRPAPPRRGPPGRFSREKKSGHRARLRQKSHILDSKIRAGVRPGLCQDVIIGRLCRRRGRRRRLAEGGPERRMCVATGTRQVRRRKACSCSESSQMTRAAVFMDSAPSVMTSTRAFESQASPAGVGSATGLLGNPPSRGARRDPEARFSIFRSVILLVDITSR